jgi:hypothetical protein
MSVLPLNRVQCDRCHTVIVLAATKSQDFGAELHAAHWRARRIKGRYQHACSICAPELLAEAEGRKARAA